MPTMTRYQTKTDIEWLVRAPEEPGDNRVADHEGDQGGDRDVDHRLVEAFLSREQFV